jgi:histone demethylase JARID1
MYLQFTDTQIDELVQGVIQTGPTPDNWIEKLENAMNSKSGPTIKKLKDLIKEAQSNDIPQEPIDNLKRFIEILDQWNSDADRLLGLKHDNTKQTETRYKRCQNLIERALEIGFDLVQLPDVEAYAMQLEDLDNQITADLLSSNNFELQSELFNKGLQIRSDSINFRKLRKAIEYNSWEESVQKAFSNHFVAKTYRKLIKEGEDMAMTTADDPLFKRLVDTEEFGKRVVQHLENIIKGREKIGMDEQQSIFNIGYNVENPDLSIELDPQLISRLKNSLSRSRTTLKELDTMLNRKCTNANIADRPTISEAQKLTTFTRELCFHSELATRLAFELSRNSSWNEHLRSTLMNGRQKALDVVLKEILTNVQRITNSEGRPNLYCICRKPESGLMIECDVCHEWYHGSCLKVARNAARSTSSYVCPICHSTELSRKIPHQSRQPTLQEITELVNFGETLSFRPKDFDAISNVHKIMQNYKNHVQAFCRSKEHLEFEDVNQMKYYLRTLMGLEVLLLDETDFLRSKIETLAPVIGPVVKSTTTSPSTGPLSASFIDQIQPYSSHKKTTNHKKFTEPKKAVDYETFTNDTNFAGNPTDVARPVDTTKPVDTNNLADIVKPTDITKPADITLKRKLVTTVGPSPTNRPHKIIKLTVKPPKPTSINSTSPSPSSSTSSSSTSTSSSTLLTSTSLSPNKKRKHKQDDNKQSSKKLK